MHALGLLHTSLGSACPTIHARRLAVLVKATETLCQCAQLTLSGIGRALASRALVKHNIKRIDRLLGNPFLYAERVCLYEAMLRWLVADKQPIIVVDWSDLSADRRWQLLRAAVPLGGRTLTLYEEVHPLKHLGNRRVHRLFLKTLRSLLPAGVKPMIVTDAGFRSTWFELILAQGWSWVGRIRNRDYVCLAGTEAWAPCKTLYVGATARPQRLGPALMVRSKPIAAILHRVRRPKRRRVKKSVFGEPVRSAHSNKHAAREREPWLIASSCDLAEYSAKQIIAIYAKRMQIEEGFRDLKSTRYGLGFSANRSQDAKRLEILLLLGALALFLLWLIGASAQAQAYHYQSNSTRRRVVLSVVFLGMQVMRRSRTTIGAHNIGLPLTQLQEALRRQLAN
jgi:hypothetical protein